MEMSLIYIKVSMIPMVYVGFVKGISFLANWAIGSPVDPGTEVVESPGQTIQDSQSDGQSFKFTMTDKPKTLPGFAKTTKTYPITYPVIKVQKPNFPIDTPETPLNTLKPQDMANPIMYVPVRIPLSPEVAIELVLLGLIILLGRR
uniref:hypothetical protein n=1 Tax=Hydrocytium acuminatum TaxID=1745963 RepID=UPI002A825103|nr:hypothetical protein UYM18_pgp042 [Hydrocytium acuminatum]WOR09575.1 hypothetical protein [Hydrocytium acuminatum]